MRLHVLFITILLVAGTSTPNRICSSNGHVNGAWKLRGNWNRTAKSFVCCGWQGDYLWNEGVCGKESLDSAINSHIYFGDSHYQSGGHACQCDRVQGRTSVHPRERYEWVPRDCNVLPWNATQFCSLLAERTVLIMGDSIAIQTWSTLVGMIQAGSGKCGGQVFIQRCDALYKCLGAGNRDFFRTVDLVRPDIAVISAGAHIYSTKEFQAFWSKLSVGLTSGDWWKKKHPALKIIWQTQNPGHVHCLNHTRPLSAPRDFSHNYGVHNWHLFPTFDALSRNHSARLRLKVVDMSPLYLRPDAHPGEGDCLHFCLPGPLDLFSNLLLNMLHNREV